MCRACPPGHCPLRQISTGRGVERAGRGWPTVPYNRQEAVIRSPLNWPLRTRGPSGLAARRDPLRLKTSLLSILFHSPPRRPLLAFSGGRVAESLQTRERRAVLGGGRGCFSKPLPRLLQTSIFSSLLFRLAPSPCPCPSDCSPHGPTYTPVMVLPTL